MGGGGDHSNNKDKHNKLFELDTAFVWKSIEELSRLYDNEPLK